MCACPYSPKEIVRSRAASATDDAGASPISNVPRWPFPERVSVSKCLYYFGCCGYASTLRAVALVPMGFRGKVRLSTGTIARTGLSKITGWRNTVRQCISGTPPGTSTTWFPKLECDSRLASFPLPHVPEVIDNKLVPSPATSPRRGGPK